ncbi:DUF2837 family protein [Paenibacillus sp. LHD-117]|uniref:lipid II flippase family protein n=1 Tax=Paenibacillus sp. LHD-117 TaxID=3071412 RepID=UPI0027E08775|nr:DUF2837 family protein [Paenibacillus sp. LHD-117]MDQ6420577.1 DUF2837 family protein [Paenibacillus sp. LHD-117]
MLKEVTTIPISLIFVMILTVLIHASDTLSYSIRYAGVRVGKYAVALSLSGIVVLVSRTSNLIQAPITGNMVDEARDNMDYPIEAYFRMILGASSIGTIIAIILFPTAVFIAARLIARFEEAGSIPRLMTTVGFNQIKSAKSLIKAPTFRMLSSLRIYGIPKRLLLLNCFVTAIFTTGVMSSLYASFLNSENSMAASQASGLINGIATIILTIIIDPKIALLTDKALKNEKEKTRLGKVFGLLMISRLAGTLLAQLVFLPASYWIYWIVGFI